ncbi:MAG: cation-translocating P-type ATPase, partial [Caldilineaceae bacterium]|nr:cation-translocating P-type ATPase [Caldilineaceae bacterium]
KAVEFGRAIYNNLFNYVRFQMEQLVGFISAYLLAAYLVVLGGEPFSPFVVLFLNFVITVPLAIALGLDKPASDLMEHTPRPLKQPILNRSQWVRIAFIGILTAIFVVYVEAAYYVAGDAAAEATAATMGFVAFALLSVVMGLSARYETQTAFNRDIFHDRTQMLLYGIALGMTFLATEMNVFQELLGLTSLTGDQWLIIIGCSIALLLVDEVFKFFLRRRHGHGAGRSAPAAATSIS